MFFDQPGRRVWLMLSPEKRGKLCLSVFEGKSFQIVIIWGVFLAVLKMRLIFGD